MSAPRLALASAVLMRLSVGSGTAVAASALRPARSDGLPQEISCRGPLRTDPPVAVVYLRRDRPPWPASPVAVVYLSRDRPRRPPWPRPARSDGLPHEIGRRGPPRPDPPVAVVHPTGDRLSRPPSPCPVRRGGPPAGRTGCRRPAPGSPLRRLAAAEAALSRRGRRSRYRPEIRPLLCGRRPPIHVQLKCLNPNPSPPEARGTDPAAPAAGRASRRGPPACGRPGR